MPPEVHSSALVIRGARTHNLKNVDLTLPAGQLPEMPAQTGENVTINANIDGDGKLDVMLTELSGNRTST